MKQNDLMVRINLSSIRNRLTALLVAGAIGLGALISISIWWVVDGELTELMDHGLQESAELIHNVLSSAPDPTHQQHPSRPDSEYAEHLIWQLVNVDTGKVIARSSNAPDTPLATAWHADVQHAVNAPWHMVTLEFRHSKQTLLVVAQTEEERHEALVDTLGYTLLTTLTVCALGIWAMSRRMRVELQPLQQLSDGVRNYDPLLPATAPTSTGRAELQPIENAIYDLGQRLGQRIISEQAFTAHAAHALRTPMAGIDAQLALAIREAPEALRPRLERAREAASRLSRVMQALLGMFRSGLEPRRVQIPLRQLLEPLGSTGLHLAFDPYGQIEVDPDLLTPVLINLLDNAHRHKAKNVEITVSEIGAMTRLIIQDDGEGCPTEVFNNMREALDRQDYGPQSGFKGLGIILADLVMRAHGGRTKLLSPASGFALELTWPRGHTATAS